MAGGKIFFEEASLWDDGKYSTALILVRKIFLDENPDLIREFLKIHVRLTRWIQDDPFGAKKAVQAEIKQVTGKELPDQVFEAAFSRILFTTEPLVSSIHKQAKAAYEAGFLKKEPDLTDLFSLSLLEDVLLEAGAAT